MTIKPKFEIDASVVYQLGEMLISDEIQALVELVKNSYDADASYANIIVNTTDEVGNNSINYTDELLNGDQRNICVDGNLAYVAIAA